jgi:hypothetical protein
MTQFLQQHQLTNEGRVTGWTARQDKSGAVRRFSASG